MELEAIKTYPQVIGIGSILFNLVYTLLAPFSLQSFEKLATDSLQGHSLQARSLFSLTHAFTPAASPIGLSNSEEMEGGKKE